jgi:hypothetical protein
VRFAPFNRLAFVGSASHTALGLFERSFGDSVSGRTIDENGIYQPIVGAPGVGFDSLEVARYVLAPRTHLRAEAGLRIRDLWISAGLLRRGATTLLPPSELVRASSSGTAARSMRMRGRLPGATRAASIALAIRRAVSCTSRRASSIVFPRETSACSLRWRTNTDRALAFPPRAIRC